MPDFPLRWLYLDLNSYFASVEQQLEPSYRGKPVAVVPVMSDSTCAIAASYEAKALGIKTGTLIYEAKKMCPELILAHARHDAYVEYHHKIKNEMENHLPVSIVASIDEFACRLMDNEAAPEIARNIAVKMKKGIADNVGEYLRSSIGIAPSKYLAKIATELEKPNGLVILETKDLPRRLLPLKLRDLPGVGRNMEMRLRLNGVGTIQDLWELSPKDLRRIWHSVWGEKIWHMLRGEIIHDLLDCSKINELLRGDIVIIPIVNAPGFINNVRYMPDRRDLNRSFPGAEKGSLAGRLAHFLNNEILSQCTHAIDLHAGAANHFNMPQIRIDIKDKKSLAMAKAFAPELILSAEQREGSFRSLALQKKIPMLLFEGSEAGRFDDETSKAGCEGILNVLKYLEMIPGQPKTRKDIFIATENHWMRAPETGIFYATRQRGQHVKNEEVIGFISDPLCEKKTEIKATCEGMVIGQNLIPVVHEGDALFNIACI